jgi:predicted dehydrogenase
VVYSIEAALALKPDAALITGPASSHVATGLALARQGVPLFIEKPLSNTLEGVDALLRLCREKGLPLMVGYNFRFHRPLQASRHALIEGTIGRPLYLRAEVGQYLPDWRPGKDYRTSVSARADMGGGVVLELSHELDYARWLLGEVVYVQATTAKVSDLEIDVEDTAEVTLRFQSGAVGSIHLDMVQRTPTRSCRIVGSEGTLVWDAMTGCVSKYSALRKDWEVLPSDDDVDRNEMYVAELKHFLDCVRSGQTPEVAGEDGKAVLEIALAVKRSSAEGRGIEL